MKASFLLVAFNTELDNPPAMKKYITEAEYKLLKEDFVKDIELNEIPYTITAKRTFQHSQFDGQVLMTIIDVKPAAK